MWVRAFACWLERWRRQRRQTGQGEQEFVCGIEEVQVSVDRTVRRSEEDGGASRVVDGDISLESGATARFFNDVRRRVHWQDVNPSETKTGRFAGTVESLLADEMRGGNVDGLSVRIERKSSCATGPEQILEPDRHIGCSGVKSRASGSGLCHGACSFVVGADEQMAALLLARKERRVLHVERVESALRKQGCVLLVCGGLEGIAEEVEGDIGVERGGAGSAA